MICPRCQQDAPTRMQGMRAYCTACGAERPIIGSQHVNVAGQPAKAGGLVASVFGWIVLAIGLTVALVLWGIANALFPGAAIAWILAMLVGVPSVAVGGGFIFGGKKLRDTGTETAQRTQEKAIFALAAARRGSVTVAEASRALDIPHADADALLTSLAKRPDGRVSLEVDDDGTLRYVFADLAPPRRFEEQVAQRRVRVPGEAPSTDAIAEAEAELDAELHENRRATR